MVKRGDLITKAKVNKGSSPEVNIIASQNFGILSKKGTNADDLEKEIIINEEIHAPINQGDVLGHMIVRMKGQEVGKLNLIAESSIEKATWWELLKRATKSMFFNFE